MNNYKYIYILINENIKILGVYNDDVSLIKYIVETIDNLKMYNIDIKKIYENITKWKISCFTNYEIGYYKIVNNELIRSNNNIPIIDIKLDIIEQINHNYDYEINKIFIAETDIINCNIKLTNDDIKNLNIKTNIANELHGTETLIKNCLLTENDSIIVSTQKSNADILKEKLLKLEKERNNKIEKKNQELLTKERKKKMEIERTLKINKDNEDKYIRKYLVDRKLYFVFKNEIIQNIKNEDQIPLMYKKQWNIFKEMENSSILDTSIINIDEYSSELNKNNNLLKLIQKEICQYKILDDKYKKMDFNYNTNLLFTSNTNTNGKFWRMEDDNLTDNDCNAESSDESNYSESSDSSDSSVEFTGPLLEKLNDSSIKINFNK
jgi:hypothetical protein